MCEGCVNSSADRKWVSKGLKKLLANERSWQMDLVVFVCNKDSECRKPQVLDHKAVTALLMWLYAKKYIYRRNISQAYKLNLGHKRRLLGHIYTCKLFSAFTAHVLRPLLKVTPFFFYFPTRQSGSAPYLLQGKAGKLGWKHSWGSTDSIH